jgi:hypothetical protein
MKTCEHLQPRLTLLLIVLLAVGAAVDPAAAVEKVGTTSIQTLKLAVGVRGVGMGNAMVAGPRDAEAVWWNPGALTEMQGTQAWLSQINMPANVQLNSLVLARKWGDYSAVALHAINLATDDMPVRTWDRPQGTGENFAASDLAVGVTYARKLTDKFSLGGNVRYLRSALDADAVYNGVSVDVGTLYKTGLRSLRLGMAIQNLGPDVTYAGSFEDFRNRVNNGDVLVSSNFEGASLPTVFRLGIAFDAFQMFGLALDSLYTSELAVEMNHPNDNRERLNLGGEVGYRNVLFLRVGGKFAYDEESFAAGFGLRIPVFAEYHLRFDYAYSHWGRLTDAGEGFMDQPHRFALGFEW